MPETKWFLAKREVKSSGDTKVQHSDYNTKINCKAATRADSGRYTITAENTNGKDVAEVEVIVLSVPSPPGGPLKVCITTSLASPHSLFPFPLVCLSSLTASPFPSLFTFIFPHSSPSLPPSLFPSPFSPSSLTF